MFNKKFFDYAILFLEGSNTFIKNQKKIFLFQKRLPDKNVVFKVV